MKKYSFIFLLFIAFTTHITAQDWDKIYEEHEGLRVVKKDNKYGFIDKTGKVSIPVVYEKVGHFKGGLAGVKLDGKWKYIDKNESIVYDKYNKEKEGLRVVIKNKKYGYINSDRKLVIPLSYDKAFDFKNGYAIVQKDGKRGFVNQTGKVVVPIVYDKAFNFSDGLGTVEKNGKQGFVDNTGKVIVPIIYDKAFAFKNGKATVVLNNKKGKVNTTGKVTWGLAIGDYAHGGVVIKLDESGEHGVVCAIGDCGGFGKEWQFTDAESCAEGIRSKVKGKMWRLPNLDELKLIHKHGDLIRKTSTDHGDSNGFRGDYYWSSKKDYNNRFNHYVGHLRGGGGMMTQIADINAKHSVRAVRDF